jgi:hypothetical protein
MQSLRVTCNVPDLGRSHIVAALSLFHCDCQSLSTQGPILSFLLRSCTGEQRLSFVSPRYFPYMSTSQPNMSVSTPPQELIPDADPHTTPRDPAQTAHSSPEQASSVENPSEPPAPVPILVGSRSASPRRASSSSYHAAMLTKPVPELPRVHMAEGYAPTEVPQRVASPTFQIPASVSTHGGGRVRANTPPRKSVRLNPSYPTLDETVPAPRPVFVPPEDFYHRPATAASRYADSEMAWHARDEREPVRLITLS